MGRFALRVFLMLVGMNAAIGIAVLIAGGLGPTGGRILLTSLCLTAAVMVGLACSTGGRTLSLQRVWPVGAVCAAAGFALLIVGIWSEPDNETFWKFPGTLIAVCVAVALVSLAGLATLPERLRWMFTVVEALTAVLLAMIVIAMWGEVSSSWFSRIFGAFAVALAAFLLVIPVLARVGAREAPAAGGTTRTRVAFCPNCGRPITFASGEDTHCRACGATFEVRFRDVGQPHPIDPQDV
jgi:hypothetical protein